MRKLKNCLCKCNCFLWIVLFRYSLADDASFIEVTSDVFNVSTGYNGYVAAFGDINQDDHADVFIISDSSNISILLGGSEKQTSLTVLQKFYASVSSDVSSVVPTDFNGDGFMDLLLTYSKNSEIKMKVFWGDKNEINEKNVMSFEDGPLKDQPLLMDVDGNMIPDLFISYSNNTRGFLLGHPQGSSSWNFQPCDFVTEKPIDLKNVRVPHSNAFIDLTGEGIADLFVTSVGDEKGSYNFEIWKSGGSGLSLISEYAIGSWNEVGQSLFADVNGDGKQDHLMPVCDLDAAGSCQRSKIVMRNGNNWTDLYQAEDGWNFVSIKASKRSQPMTLVIGDYNQDVFIDIICIMQQTTGDKVMDANAVLLYGAKCLKDYCSSVGTMFKRAFVVPSSTGTGAFSATFYDLENDGTLDFLVSSSNGPSTTIRAYRNTVAEDVSFLKAKVLPGLEKSSSANSPGACVSYVTTNTMGGSQKSSSCQLSQSAHLSLQLPYVSFGLGRLPNFIDTLKVSIPTPLLKCGLGDGEDGTAIATSKTWTMIIPNSQLFIKPYPTDNPSSWGNRLLVSPGKNVITTGIVLLSTCGLVSVIIIVLHCLERKEDKQEKIQEAHRFHFDAM